MKSLAKPKFHISGLLLFVMYLTAGVLLYALVPVKGIVWPLLYILQAFGSFFFFRFIALKKTKEYNFRVAVMRHFFCQISLFAIWCLMGFVSCKIMPSKPGYLAFGLCMFATLVYNVLLRPEWMFASYKTCTKAEKKFYKLDQYFYAFFTVITLHTVLYAIYGVYPFGENLYLRMDCYHQYTPFIKEFYDKIRNGDGLLFNFHSGLGVNYFTHFGYYLSSPTTFLYLLLPEKYLVEGIEAGMMLKGALASVTFLYYLNSRKGGRNILRMAFALFYALSAFYLAYSCNIMWADSYVLFPLIMLGLERIAKGKSPLLYGISMGLCVFSNFYMAAICAIAVVLYFISLIIIHAKEGNTFKKILNFVFSSIVVGLVCAVILLPEYYCLRNTAAGGTTFPKEWQSYFAFHQLFERMLTNVNTIQNNSELPNIYCGILAFIGLFTYFGNRKIKLLSKITNGVLVLFLLFSFQWNIFYYVWHGLHFPNSFPARFSFFFIFLVLSMASESVEERKGLHPIYLVVSSSILFAGCFVFWAILSKDNLLNGLTAYLCSAVLILLYTALLILERKMKGKMIKSIFLLVLLVELSVNTLCVGVNSVVDRDDYFSNLSSSKLAIAKIRETDTSEFVRVERPDKKYMNEGCYDGYNSASYFSSTISDGVKQFYADLGMRYSDVAYSYQGGNPFLASILGIDYFISEYDEHMGEEGRLNILSEDDGTKVYLYRNYASLGLGYTISEETADSYPKMEAQHPFLNQNAFAKSFGTDKPLFISLPVYEYTEGEYDLGNSKTKSGKATIYHVKAGVHPYFYVVNYLDSIRIINQDTQGNIIDTRLESGLKFRHILDLGVYDIDRVIVMMNEDDAEEKLTFQAYVFNQGTYRELMDQLSSEKLKITDIGDRSFTGQISCAEDEVLLFTIPYDEGFTVFVDGQETETQAYADAFLSVPVSKGDHTVKVRYMPPGLKAGGLISFGGILLAILWILSGVIEKAHAKKSVE